MDDRNYIVTFPKPTKIHLNCSQEQHKTIQGSYLARVPRNCKITAPEFTIINIENKIKGQVLEIMDIGVPTYISENNHQPTFNLTSIELSNLHNIQKQLTMEKPIELEKEDSSVYHTTIPFYSTMLIATIAISIVYLVRRKRAMYIVKNKNEVSAQVELPNIETSEQRRAATFSLDVGK